MLDILMILLSYHLSYFVLSYVILCSFVLISVSLLIVPAQDIDPNSAFFLRYTYETPIFLGQTHRTGLITCPPYPEVTLDTFGFPVGGRLAARRAVSRPRLPKVALFGPKSGFFGQKSIFCPHPPISSLPS